MSRAEDFLTSYGEKQSKAAKFLDDYKPPKRTAEVYLEAKKPVKSPAEAFLEAKQPQTKPGQLNPPTNKLLHGGSEPRPGVVSRVAKGFKSEVLDPARQRVKELIVEPSKRGLAALASVLPETVKPPIPFPHKDVDVPFRKPVTAALTAVPDFTPLNPDVALGTAAFGIGAKVVSKAPVVANRLRSLMNKRTNLLAESMPALPNPKSMQLELSPAFKYPSGEVSVAPGGHRGISILQTNAESAKGGFIDAQGNFYAPNDLQKLIDDKIPFKINASAKTLKHEQDIAKTWVKQDKDFLSVKPSSGEPKPSFFDDVKALWRRVGPTQERTQLNKIAPEVEKKFQIATRQYQTNLGRIKEKYIAPHAKLDLTDAEKLAIRDFMDKGTKSAALTPRAEAAAKDLLKAYRAEGMLAQNAKLKVNIGTEFERPFYRRKNLGRYPNIPDKKAYENPAVQQQQIEYWMKQKSPLNPDKPLVESEAEGRAILDEMLGKSPNTFTDFSPYKGTRKVHSLEQSRVYDLLYKESDPIKTMSEHLDKGLRRIENIKQFGQQNEKITPVLQEMQKQGKDVDYVTNILTRELKGLPDKRGQQAGKTVRQVTSMMDLQLSAILNSHQGITGSTIRSGSPKIAASSLKDAMTKEGWAWARKSGVIDNKQVQEYFDMITAADKTALGKASDFYSKIHLFKPSETFNFVIASNAGKRYVQEKLVPAFLKNSGSQKLKEELLSFGLNPEFVLKTGGKLSESQLLKASNQFASETIFALRPTDLPQAAKQSELGKLAYRYMGFPVQQMNLVAKSIPKHPIGATVGTAASAGLTYGANEFRKMLTGKKDTQKKTDVQKVVSAIAMSGALGKYGDAAMNSMTSRRGIAEAFSPVILSKPSRLAYEALNEPKKLPKSLVSMFAPYGQITSRVLPPFDAEPKNRKRPTRSRKKK